MEQVKETVKKVNPLTDKMKGAIAFLRANDGAHFCQDIADALGIEGKNLSPVLTSLVKRGLAETSEGQREVKDKNGNPVTRTYKMYSLTEDGNTISLD